jgi:lysophospholipase L1-like esterase
MAKNVSCIDDALNGRSSKSFIDEGAWKKALDEHGNYYLIQWGHNDQKKEDPKRYTDPATSFQVNLKRYIADVRTIGAVPVLVTSLSRRNYRNGQLVEDLTAYVQATKKVGAEEGIAVIDLNAISVGILRKMTQDEADKFDRGSDPATGKLVKAAPDAVSATASGVDAPKAAALDRTHLNSYGQKVFGRIVAEQLGRVQGELAPDVVGEPANGAGK